MRELIFLICFIGPIKIYSQYDSELLIKQFDTICINNSFEIASQNIDKYPTSIKFVDLKDSFGIENLADLLFKNFELLDSLTKYEEAECVLGEIVKIHEFHRDTEMIATVMSVRTYYNFSKANNVYLAKILAEKTVHLYSLFSHKDTSLVNHLAMQQNTIYHSLGIKEYIPIDNKYYFFQIHELVESGDLKTADSLLLILDYNKLNVDDKSDFLRYLIAIRFLTGDEILEFESEILKFIKEANDEAYTVLYYYSLYKYMKNDQGALDFLLEFDNKNCQLKSQINTNSPPLPSNYCALFTYLKGSYLMMVNKDSNGKNLMLSVINDITLDLNDNSSFKSNVYFQIGDIYVQENKIDSAIYCLNLARQFYFENQNDISGQDQIYYLSAKIDEYLGNIPSAILNYEKKVQHSLKHKYLINLVQDKIKLAELNIKSLKIDQAQYLLDNIDNNEILSINDLQYYTSVRAILLMKKESFNEAKSLISESISLISSESIKSVKTNSLYFDNKLTLLEVAVRTNNFKLAKILFDEISSEVYNAEYNLFTNSRFILFLGLGYAINKETGNNDFANKLKIILNEELLAYASNEYRDIVALISILGVDSEVFDKDYLANLLTLYLDFYETRQVSSYEAEYGNKIFYYYLRKYGVQFISYNSKLSRYLINFQDLKDDERRSNNVFLNSTMRLNDPILSTVEKSSLLQNVYSNFVSSKFGNIENELLTKIAQNEALIKIMIFEIDSFKYYVTAIFKQGTDSISIVLLDKLSESRILDEFQRVLNENDAKSHQYLYEKLWLPMESQLLSIRKITIVPKGIYSSINLNVIKNGSKQYLVDKYDYIQCIYSLRSLTYQILPFLNDKIFFLGDPNYSGNLEENNFRGNILLERDGKRDGSWVALPNTKLEVENNIKYWNPKLSSLLIDTFATEEMFFKIQSPRILHIATHGFVNSMYRTFDPGFVLANANLQISDENSDGYIYSRDIAEMDFTYTELVTLSMCESGIGYSDLSSAISSLGNSFLIAGASNVMYSVAKVNDESTKFFMNSFYQYYSHSLNPTYSISKAMREIKERFELPKYWGGFVLMTTTK